jgi:hypothetical protein
MQLPTFPTTVSLNLYALNGLISIITILSYDNIISLKPGLNANPTNHQTCQMANVKGYQNMGWLVN